ncbi:minor capsid protein [Natroniella sp. ANB-PHB2]|uniref:minor capsid protein n=1 Tax=Natroniella sp. ANB-PHB2 TaxID=3384444 RepID=UPI0038D49DA4
MCRICGNLALVYNKTDPTRSKVLRQKYSAEMYKRWRRIKGAIRKVLIEYDALHLKGQAANEKIFIPRNFEFENDAEKVETFMAWLDEAVDVGVLEIMERDGREAVKRKEWQNIYIKSAYEKGLKQADSKMKKLGLTVPDDDLSLTLAKPIHADKLGLLYTRNFQELRGITEEVDQQVSRVLAEGMGQGLNPREIARNINDRVSKIGITRARTLARTEIIRSHAESTLNRYEEYGIGEVAAEIEFSHAGDDRVCDLCRSLGGRTFTLKEARGIIPVHPNCFDSKTEVFTDEGWKLFKELKGHEKIFSRNPDDLEVGYLPYDKFISYQYEGPMYHLTGDSLDLMVTPDHNQPILENGRMIIKSMKEVVKQKDFSLLTSESKINSNNLNIKRVDYSGMVYDVELPKWHILLVRRNGKTVWSGNCRCAWLPVI